VGIFSRRKNATDNEPAGYKIGLITERGNGFYSWNGKLFQSDVIRSCIRPKAKAIGKLLAKHIREGPDGIKINPEAYMRFLLEEPNPYMTGQLLQEKLATQLELNNNAFALIVRDENGWPFQIYPIPGIAAEAVYDVNGELSLKFTLKNGKTITPKYRDVIHLRQDYNENDIFGESPSFAITSLMDIVTTTDQGIVKAIKNSAVVKWIMMFKNMLKKDDKDLAVEEFTNNYLAIDNAKGVATSDPRYELKEVSPQSYVPNAAQMDRTLQRIYNFFNTNEKIVQSKFTEDEWNAYYEASIEPCAIQMSGEFTRKLFSRKERGFGNKIMFEASSLQYASMSTKLGLVSMVDRGAMTPNEWRWVMNMGPIEGGEKPLRRLDTAVVEGGGSQ
jgi:HK97 family phage portal protein